MPLPRPADQPAAPQPTFATLARERDAREAALAAGKAGFEATMAESEREMIEQIRAETPDYFAGSMEPDGDAGGFDVDMDDLPSPDIYGTAAWSRERERRITEQISDTTAAAIRADMSQRRPPQASGYAAVADDGELWGEDLIAEALRAEHR